MKSHSTMNFQNKQLGIVPCYWSATENFDRTPQKIGVQGRTV